MPCSQISWTSLCGSIYGISFKIPDCFIFLTTPTRSDKANQGNWHGATPINAKHDTHLSWLMTKVTCAQVSVVPWVRGTGTSRFSAHGNTRYSSFTHTHVHKRLLTPEASEEYL